MMSMVDALTYFETFGSEKIYWTMVITNNTQKLAELIREAQHIVAFTGAGTSTPSGIPDFRSPESGLWDHVDPMKVASIFGFRQNPQAFYDWVEPLAILTRQAQPNPAHTALATLEKMGKLQAIITQNIDMLHTRAGNKVIFELHGHMRTATCISCFTKVDAEPILTEFLAHKEVPLCQKCRGYLKPDVILFGEQLPWQQLQGAKDAARASDLMLIVGSSLEVAPASDIPVLAKRTGAKVAIVNLEPTGLDHIADVVINDDAATILPEVVSLVAHAQA
jgi:NAD-dependent deacetylase